MLVPFITGFAKESGDIIDERDKEIRATVNERMNYLLKKREQALTQSSTRRDELREQAKQLQALSGNRLTETQIAGILETGEADTLIANLRKSSGGLTNEQIAQLYTPAKDEAGTVEGIIGKMTELQTTPELPGMADEQRGAFGLRTTSAAEEKKKFAATANISLDDIYKNKFEKATKYKPAGLLDLSVFATPESDTQIKAKLRDKLAEATQGFEPGTPEYDAAMGKALSTPAVRGYMDKVRAMIVVDELSKAEDGEKPRTAAQINSIISNSLRSGLDVLVTKGVIRWDPTAQDYVPIVGDAKAVASYLEQKTSIIRDVMTARGIITRDGKIVGGRNAEDALAPYANIEDGRIVSWKNAADKKTTQADTMGKTRNPPPEVWAQMLDQNLPNLSEAEKAEALMAYTRAYAYNVKITKEANPQTDKALTGIEQKRAVANGLIARNPAIEQQVRDNFKKETGEDL
jgi:hypothetical protein